MSTTTTPTTTTPGTTTRGASPATAPATEASASDGAATASLLLGLVAGYIGHRTVAIGLRTGLIAELADEPGAAPSTLAERLDLDTDYTAVWCRSALASGLVERDRHGLRLAAGADTLLLDEDAPSYIGGIFRVMSEPEMFDRFEGRLATGERTWWDETSDRWVRGVSGTGRPFYTRLVPDGLGHVPGLGDALAAGCRIVDTACGTGTGVVRLATTYPDCDVVGVDGDARSLAIADERARAAGVDDRVSLVHSPIEQFALAEPARLVINNISMHECRDIDEATRRVRAALEPGGTFVISDFPFPDTDAGLRTLPGRIMAGIQFFEAQIDDQLVPRTVYDDLLDRHGFVGLGSTELTPTHALTWGRVPRED